MRLTETEIPQDDIETQKQIIAQVFELNSKLEKTPLAFIDTYGCQQNVADSETLRGMLSDMGYGFTETENLCRYNSYQYMRDQGTRGNACLWKCRRACSF